MQRARLLGAAAPMVDELGWAGVTVADIASRARVSRRTFYDLFSNREDCLLAVLEDAVGRVERDLQAASLGGVSWVERVRTGLWGVLCFLDRDPALARVCVVQSARGSRRVLEAREEILSRLARTIDEGRSNGARVVQAPPLTAEGVVGASLAIIYKRLLTGDPTPLCDLHGDLMGVIVLPYLGSAAAVKERKRRPPQAVEHPARAASRRRVSVREEDPLSEVPMRLTYRTARVLQTAARRPGVSNRLIGEGAGITDQGQVSKLLARLHRLGLLTNTGEGQSRGECNAWKLTPLGQRVIEQLSLDTAASPDREQLS
jgi:AcrR family transcriptional regulator/DNA-binding MarR family transcriptional regulator